MAIETLFYTTNQKTVIAVAEARGVLLLVVPGRQACRCSRYAAAGKQSVSGYGKATKKQVQEMTDAFEAARRAQTGRHGRRAGYGHLHAYSYRSKQ